jgi:putative membrane protein insertion efficiency factor
MNSAPTFGSLKNRERLRPSRFLRLSALALLSFYRFAISPLFIALFGPACRFEPSCSQFASDAIRIHGLPRGTVLALRRLLRCHPMGGHGYDPVPVKR